MQRTKKSKKELSVCIEELFQYFQYLRKHIILPDGGLSSIMAPAKDSVRIKL